VLEIVPLSRAHDHLEFDCGVAGLNFFLRATARLHGEKGISRSFVLVETAAPTTILGFFTLTLCEIATDHLPKVYAKKLPKHGLPAVRLARLAVALRYQKKGYGKLLLADAVFRTVQISKQAGGIGLFVDAKDDKARSFYDRYGFISLPDQDNRLFLPLKTLLASTT